jgi:anti-anti-sigma regulatory factor
VSSTGSEFEVVLSEINAYLPVAMLRGRVTQFSESALLSVLDAHPKGSGVLALDFSGVDSISGTGLIPLFVLAIKARQRGILLYAVNLTDHYKRVFRLARLDIGIRAAGSMAEVRLAAFHHRGTSRSHSGVRE